jgi:hypothetical protein
MDARLIGYIAKHGIAVRWLLPGVAEAEHVYCVDGVAHSERVEVELTVAAVREWLGY